MAENPTGSAPSPDDKSGQAPNNNTPSPGANQPEGGKKDPNGGGKVEIDEAELNQLRRDAGRHRAKKADDRKNRDSNRARVRSGENPGDDDDDEIKRRDEVINQKDSEIVRLKVDTKVRDLLDSDEFKALPKAIKSAVRRNPMGFVRPESKEFGHYVEDIEDYLQDALDDVDEQPNNTEKKADEDDTEKTRQTPPAKGSGPSSPNGSAEESLEGKTGPARSTAVLRNMLKKGKK